MSSTIDNPPPLLMTGLDVRLEARNKTHLTFASDLAPSHLQANLIILPSIYAPDFRLLGTRNPVPCPLLAESACPGSYSSLVSHIPGITG